MTRSIRMEGFHLDLVDEARGGPPLDDLTFGSEKERELEGSF
ncbi:MAG TPA: hypothetical protein VHF88_05025 [Thermoleophilaceae bacterium]|nr:hypothetical protein [Thermoleophilaceae bacterium]